MKTINYAAEIARLERERDVLDEQWRRLRHAGVQTPEEGRERDLRLADIEIQYRETEAALARLHIESIERRLASVDDVDADALARAEAAYLEAQAVYDELQQLQRAAYSRRRDALADLKAARRTLAEAEYALEQRRAKRDELAARPIRHVQPAAMLIGDGRT